MSVERPSTGFHGDRSEAQLLGTSGRRVSAQGGRSSSGQAWRGHTTQQLHWELVPRRAADIVPADPGPRAHSAVHGHSPGGPPLRGG